MTPITKLRIYFYSTFFIYLIVIASLNISIATSNNKDDIEIIADTVAISNDGNKINANGNILIKTEEFLSSSDITTYNKEKNEINSLGNIVIKDKLNNYYFFDSFTTDQEFNTAVGSNVKIRMNDGVRIVGNSFSRIDSNINQINNASYTPCLQNNYIIKNCPGWKLNAKKVIHDVEGKSVYYEGAVLSILNVPILYSPFFSHPDPTVKKRTGLLMPSISSDNTLGTTLSIPFFYNISSNYDLTLTPTIQTKADDYYSLSYRHLTKNHQLNVESSISNDESNTGTKNHIFINGAVKNPFGKFDYNIETSNNDTYLRKNHINNLTILTSGLSFSKEMNNSYLDFSSYIYKHLNNSSNRKWEYVYPKVNYDIHAYKDLIFGLNWGVKNSFLNYRDLNKNYNQQISSEISSNNLYISRKTGLKFENTIQNRLIYFNKSSNDLSQLRIFPQYASKISYPLNRYKDGRTESLEPIIMPIIAPYNNYANQENVSNSNIFSLNRETSLSQWESGPRINYGINWLISYSNININTFVAQSARINKDNNPETQNEISNYFISNTLDFGNIGYVKTDITIDRKDLYLKDNNVNASVEINKVKFGFDYDYETSNKIKTSEQISIGAKINVIKDLSLISSIRKNLMTEKSIGNAFGVHFENDCLAINFDYFRDFTAISDIKNSRGFSFTITLKPFGTSKQRGKVRNFGPKL